MTSENLGGKDYLPRSTLEYSAAIFRARSVEYLSETFSLPLFFNLQLRSQLVSKAHECEGRDFFNNIIPKNKSNSYVLYSDSRPKTRLDRRM